MRNQVCVLTQHWQEHFKRRPIHWQTYKWNEINKNAECMATTAFSSDTTSHLALSGTIICFSTGHWPNTPTGCIRAIWPRRRVIECSIRWPGLHNPLTSNQLRWFGMSSQQVLSICGNSFKTVGKAFQVELVERMLRVCKAVIKAKGCYIEESQILNIFWFV